MIKIIIMIMLMMLVSSNIFIEYFSKYDFEPFFKKYL